jgi:hypothetical protein
LFRVAHRYTLPRIPISGIALLLVVPADNPVDSPAYNPVLVLFVFRVLVARLPQFDGKSVALSAL